MKSHMHMNSYKKLQYENCVLIKMFLRALLTTIYSILEPLY